jgi:hypothetical protein
MAGFPRSPLFRPISFKTLTIKPSEKLKVAKRSASIPTTSTSLRAGIRLRFRHKPPAVFEPADQADTGDVGTAGAENSRETSVRRVG